MGLSDLRRDGDAARARHGSTAINCVEDEHGLPSIRGLAFLRPPPIQRVTNRSDRLLVWEQPEHVDAITE
jgi:hypothetical protein